MTGEIETKRLRLRQWKASDRKPFAELNANAEVMEYYPGTLTKAESDLLIQRLEAKINAVGYGLWAAELTSTNDFIGYVGLSNPSPTLPCSPCVEIGWRLAKKYWGHGYATEAAQTALKFAFETLSVSEIVSFTTLHNKRSQAVMQKIGMTDTRQNFMHPDLPTDSDLREHVLFKITKAEWQNAC